MDAFLLAFWPNAAATLCGVILGLPRAMWVNRLAVSGAKQTAMQSQVQRIDHALQVLISAMEANRELLREYAEVLASSRVKWRLNLDVSAWDAIKADFIAELTDPLLRREVAFHFSQLAILTNLNQECLGFAFGTNASMSGSNETRLSISEDLKSMCVELGQQAERLIASSRATKLSLSQHAPGQSNA